MSASEQVSDVTRCAQSTW